MTERLTEIIFLLDRSGSMAGLEEDTIGGFNAFIKKQAQLPGETKLTTVLFDHEYELLWDGVEAAMKQLTAEEYYVRGTTALLDAVGKTIVDVRHRFSTQNADSTHSVIFVITTDGMENSSQEFTYAKVKELIHYQKVHHDWQFIFMGANIDAVQEAGYIGIAEEDTHTFEASEIGVQKMYDRVHEDVSTRRKK